VSTGSKATVVIALAVNLLIAVAKAIASVVTGSGAMASEAAHSVADAFNELLLLTALRRSARPPDRRHPFGHGKERFFWSLLAAVSIFGGGALFAFQEGLHGLRSHAGDQPRPVVAYVVIAVSFVLESVSWVQSYRSVRTRARERDLALRPYLQETDDPTTKAVLLEDSAALVGLLLALGGVGLHQLTGSGRWDAAASLLIGIVLTVVAYALGSTTKNLLIGSQADRRLVWSVHDRLAAHPDVEAVVDLATMTTGTDAVLVCARVDFRDGLTSADVERACVAFNEDLKAAFRQVVDVFIEPVPRDDPGLRAEVIARYGRALTDVERPASA
jgi:cation diffusion facilitator family transporter